MAVHGGNTAKATDAIGIRHYIVSSSSMYKKGREKKRHTLQQNRDKDDVVHVVTVGIYPC
jgi:hypothetical protein